MKFRAIKMRIVKTVFSLYVDESYKNKIKIFQNHFQCLKKDFYLKNAKKNI